MKRGRKSVAERSVVVELSRHRPPPPPLELTPEEAAIWRDIFTNLPPDWIPQAAHPLLVQYCYHLSTLKSFERSIRKAGKGWPTTIS